MERERARSEQTKKLTRPTDRETNTAVFLLRAYQLGISLDDLNRLSYGMVCDLITEASNDHAEYTQLATQADFDKF